MPKKRKKKLRKAKRKISYNVKVDRFFDQLTGRFIDNLTGLLSTKARRQKKIAEVSGEQEIWKDELRRRLAKKRIKVAKRRRRPPPRLPEGESYDFEFVSREGDIDTHLDTIIYRNLEYMDEEVLYQMADFEERYNRKRKIMLGDTVSLHRFPNDQYKVILISNDRESFKLEKMHANTNVKLFVSFSEICDVVCKANIKLVKKK